MLKAQRGQIAATETTSTYVTWDYKQHEQMCKTCDTDHEEFDIRAMWAEADKIAKDYREKGEVKLLKEMLSAWAGLKECGWRERSSIARRTGLCF